MPVARSTRRTRARELSSDHIEEEEHSQHHRRDSVQDDEEEQPRRKSRQVKKEKPTLTKGKGKGKVQNVPEDDDGGEGDNAASRIDVDNFHDQPLNRSDVNRLAGLAKDWETTRKGFHASSFRMMNDIGAALAEVDEEDKVLPSVDKIVRELLDMEYEMRCHEEIISEISEQIASEDLVDDALERYERNVKVRVNDYRKKTSRQKYGKSEEYGHFKQVQYEVRHPDTPMPPVTSSIPKESGDVSDEDDLEVGGVTQDYKCPITMTIVTDPLVSSTCGHSYSGEAIRGYLAGRGQRKCPASGCNKWIALSDLRKDRELERRAKAAARRLQDMDTDQNEDEDDVIE